MLQFILAIAYKMYRIGLGSPLFFWRLYRVYREEGGNAMLLLALRRRISPKRKALQIGQQSWSYEELYLRSHALAALLEARAPMQAQRVLLACHNSEYMPLLLWALGRLGAQVYPCNPELPPKQLQALQEKYNFAFCISDEPWSQDMQRLFGRFLSLDSLRSLEAEQQELAPLPKRHGGSIVLLTGGSTGLPKAAPRKVGILPFLWPFWALLYELDLDRYQRLLLPLPLYHGHGLSTLFTATALGASVSIQKRWTTEEMLSHIQEEKIEVLSLVPLHLQRLLDKNKGELQGIEKIICGSAPLSPSLARRSLQELGPKLYNLYGSSEAGFSFLATPQMLAEEPRSVGKMLRGGKLRIVDAQGKELPQGQKGFLELMSPWSIAPKGQWIATGDLAQLSPSGLLILAGREDDMIVSGGINVYPRDLEHCLEKHPHIAQALVLAIDDRDFGKRLTAFVVPKAGKALDEAALRSYLAQNLRKEQRPRDICIVEKLPYTEIGKVDRRALRALLKS